MLAAVHVLAVQQADDLGVLDEDAEGVAHQPFHRRHRVQAAHLDVAVVGAHHAVDVLHHSDEHLLLAAEVLVRQADVDAGGIDDALDARAS